MASYRLVGMFASSTVGRAACPRRAVARQSGIKNAESIRFVILSKRSASKDLRTEGLLSSYESAKIPRLTAFLGMTELLAWRIIYTAQSRRCPAGRCVAQRIKIEMIAGGNHTVMQYDPALR